mmetsp:Transcript_13542/g.53678  ORF Transcript_13542/g.53678 Transcript_13542/m.53678 type:complete len:228 (-) Transcript_13542:6-689(-)
MLCAGEALRESSPLRRGALVTGALFHGRAAAGGHAAAGGTHAQQRELQDQNQRRTLAGSTDEGRVRRCFRGRCLAFSPPRLAKRQPGHGLLRISLQPHSPCAGRQHSRARHQRDGRRRCPCPRTPPHRERRAPLRVRFLQPRRLRPASKLGLSPCDRGLLSSSFFAPHAPPQTQQSMRGDGHPQRGAVPPLSPPSVQCTHRRLPGEAGAARPPMGQHPPMKLLAFRL